MTFVNASPVLLSCSTVTTPLLRSVMAEAFDALTYTGSLTSIEKKEFDTDQIIALPLGQFSE